MTIKTVLLTSGNTWTVPQDVDTTQPVTVIAIGGGGSGGLGRQATNWFSAGGGGGGAFAQSIISLSGISTCYYSIGTGGIAPAQTATGLNGIGGTSSWFNKSTNAAPSATTNGVLAQGGQGGTFASASSVGAIALGGQASTSIGSVKFDGGTGSPPASISTDYGGGGGGSAGSSAGNGGPGRAGAITKGGPGGGIGDLGTTPPDQSVTGGKNYFGNSTSGVGSIATYGGGGNIQTNSNEYSGMDGGAGFGYEYLGIPCGPGGGGGGSSVNSGDSNVASGNGGLYGAGGAGAAGRSFSGMITTAGNGAQGAVIILYTAKVSSNVGDTLVWMDGFDLYNGTWALPYNYNIVIQSYNFVTPGRYDGQALVITDVSSGGSSERAAEYFSRIITPTVELSFGFAFRRSSISSATGGNDWIKVQNGQGVATNIMLYWLTLNDSGVINLVTPANGTVGTATIPSFTPTSWHYFEFESVGHLTNGSIKVYVDGNLLINVSGIPVYSSLANSISVDRISIKPYDSLNSSTSSYIDDLYITNVATRIGEVHIPGLKPNADTTQKDFTPASGTSNFAMVNTGYTQSTTNYVTGDANGEKDLYDLPNIAPSNYIAGNVVAVKTSGYGYKANITPASMALITNVGTTEKIETSLTLQETSIGQSGFMPNSIMPTNPKNNSSWIMSDIDSLKVGAMVTNYQNLLFTLSDGAITNGTTATAKTTTLPTVSNGAFVFNGTSQVVQYTNGTSNDQFNVIPPYSVELEFNQASLANAQGTIYNQWFFNIGTAYDDGRPALTIRTDMPGSKVAASYFTSSGDAGTSYALISTATSLNTWYKVGVMIYNDGTNNRIRGYANGIQVFDNIMASLPKLPSPAANPTTGLNIGGSDPIHPYTYFNGGIRNLRVGRSLFWKV